MTEETVTALNDAAIVSVLVAIREPDDVAEDEAAKALSEAVAGPGVSAAKPFTGRANLIAETAGILKVDANAIHKLNSIDEAVTLATLPPFARVEQRQMVGTAKIIPYAANAAALESVLAVARAAPMKVHPFEIRTCDLILTHLDDRDTKLDDKAIKVARNRLTALGADLGTIETVPHEQQTVADALKRCSADVVLILGASATSDRRDVCPAGLVAAGGRLERYGMPVDPGNLLFLGSLGPRTVIGLPGCARSPALNGADWVLERTIARVPVTGADIAHMGVGGLLKEISTRPQPRRGNRKAPKKPFVSIVLLAAGRSSRMRGRDKLMEPLGDDVLLRHAAKAALASRANEVCVITNSDQARQQVLDGLNVKIRVARDANAGMSASLRAGLSAVDPRADAVIIALADMPDIGADHYNRLIAAFAPSKGRTIARAVAEDGTPGHPVLFGKRFFEALGALEGDRGAKSVIADGEDFLVDVPTKGLGALTDLDTPEDWADWRQRS